MDRRIDYCLVGLLVLVLLATSPMKRDRARGAISNDSAEAVRRALVSIQKDRGGRVSRRNLMDAVKLEFERLDRDRDGLLDASELRTAALPVAPNPHSKSGH